MDQQLCILQMPKQLLKMITYTLESMASGNRIENQAKSIFNTRGNPTTSLSAYIARIFQFMKCSTSCFITALILLDRIRVKDSRYQISHSNAHKLIFTAILISVKVLDDNFYPQKHYASVAGLSLKEINKLQFQFLNLLDFETHVSQKTFHEYTQKLENINDLKNEVKQKEKGHNEDGINTSESQSYEERKEFSKIAEEK